MLNNTQARTKHLETGCRLWSMAARGGAMAAVALVLLVLVPEACRAEQFIVGDAARWTWGYNYTDWVVKKGPFFQNVMQGAGSGFEFVLQKRKVHYFVCGERGGIHCNAGQMKFIVKPKRSICRD
uniref:Uncharacterized protein n=1 Tax=Avena sativa TaxID=4498 RepID=A0ACD5VAI3_AVESA